MKLYIIFTFALVAIALFFSARFPQHAPPAVKGNITKVTVDRDSQVLTLQSTIWEKCIESGYHFYDQTGKKFDTKSLIGRHVVVSFFVPPCSPLDIIMQSELARLRKQFDNEIVFVSISLGQFGDRVLLADYASLLETKGKRWDFIVAESSSVDMQRFLLSGNDQRGNPSTNVKVGVVGYVAPTGSDIEEFLFANPSERERLERFLNAL